MRWQGLPVALALVVGASAAQADQLGLCDIYKQKVEEALSRRPPRIDNVHVRGLRDRCPASDRVAKQLLERVSAILGKRRGVRKAAISRRVCPSIEKEVPTARITSGFHLKALEKSLGKLRQSGCSGAVLDKAEALYAPFAKFSRSSCTELLGVLRSRLDEDTTELEAAWLVAQARCYINDVPDNRYFKLLAERRRRVAVPKALAGDFSVVDASRAFSKSSEKSCERAFTSAGKAATDADVTDCTTSIMDGDCAARAKENYELAAALGWAISPNGIGQRSPFLWLAAQECLGAARGAGFVDQATQQWAQKRAAAGDNRSLAYCLIGCRLLPDRAASLAKLEKGDGFFAILQDSVKETKERITRANGLASYRFIEREIKGTRSLLDRHRLRIPRREAEVSRKLKALEELLMQRVLAQRDGLVSGFLDALPRLFAEIRLATNDGRRAERILADAAAVIDFLKARGWSKPVYEEHLAKAKKDLGAAIKAGELVRKKEKKRQERAAEREALVYEWCENERNWRELRKAERYQRRLNRASGTVDLVAKRRLVEMRLFMGDQRKKLNRQLRKHKPRPRYEKDCASDE